MLRDWNDPDAWGVKGAWEELAQEELTVAEDQDEVFYADTSWIDNETHEDNKPGRPVVSCPQTATRMILLYGATVAVAIVIAVGVYYASNGRQPKWRPTMQCITTKSELVAAVDAYLEDPMNQTLRERYGSPIGRWCLEGLDNLDELFSSSRHPKAAEFDEDLSGWDTSRVMSMTGTFQGALQFNQLLTWNFSSVKSLHAFFKDARSYNKPIVWDTGSVIDMDGAFWGASSFNCPVEHLNLAKVQTMAYLFANATSFNQPIQKWNLSSVENIDHLLTGATLFAQPLCGWNTSLANRPIVVGNVLDGTSCSDTALPHLAADNMTMVFCQPCV